MKLIIFPSKSLEVGSRSSKVMLNQKLWDKELLFQTLTIIAVYSVHESCHKVSSLSHCRTKGHRAIELDSEMAVHAVTRFYYQPNPVPLSLDNPLYLVWHVIYWILTLWKWGWYEIIDWHFPIFTFAVGKIKTKQTRMIKLTNFSDEVMFCINFLVYGWDSHDQHVIFPRTCIPLERGDLSDHAHRKEF